jgi:hypothetical protein
MFPAFLFLNILMSWGRAASVVSVLAIKPTQVFLSIKDEGNTSAQQ